MSRVRGDIVHHQNVSYVNHNQMKNLRTIISNHILLLLVEGGCTINVQSQISVNVFATNRDDNMRTKTVIIPCEKCGLVEGKTTGVPDVDGIYCPKCGTWYLPAYFESKGLFPCCGRTKTGAICGGCGIAYV